MCISYGAVSTGSFEPNLPYHLVLCPATILGTVVWTYFTGFSLQSASRL